MSTLTPSTRLITKLNEIELKLASTNQRQSRNFSASGYVDCARMQSYGLLGYAKTNEETVPEYKRVAAYGDAIHGVLQDRLLAAGMVVMMPNFDYAQESREKAREAGTLSPALEMPLNEWTLSPAKYEEIRRYRIGGRIDGLLVGKKGPLLLEIKTIDGKYFEPNYRQYYLDKLYHFEAQAQMYLHFLELEQALILVTNRGNAKLDEYLVTYNPLFLGPELERLEKAVWQVAMAQLPEPEPNRGPCRFCAWRDLCPATEKAKGNGGFSFTGSK